MRDSHRMKEKFDLSLDNRQIVSLLIAGLVVLGAVFVLGVVVGKKLATNTQAAKAPDLLTALDQQAAAMEEVRKDASLTFQDELTKKSPEPLREEPPKVAAAEKPAEKKVEPPVPPPDIKPQPKVETPPVEQQVAKVDAAPEQKIEEAVPTRTRDGGLKDAFAAVKKATPPAEAVPNGKFTLQLSATQTKDEALRFAAKLKDSGYAPYIVEAQVPNRGTWYRVRMGSFPSRDAAARYLNDFKRETNMEAFVTTAN